MLDWFEAQAMTNMRIEHKPQIMLAVQGPEAVSKLLASTDLATLDIKPFFAPMAIGLSVERDIPVRTV